ncbi:MAG: class I SAM-dependent methyltransferase, partial [Sulfurimonas sp.]|nr:class I SAM-dependent methyltransferase [Sulfurimonas sp.]
ADLKLYLENNSKDLTVEFKRIFHGRGGLYAGFKHLTIDSIGKIISVALYFENENENELINMIQKFTFTHHDTLIVQRRYLKESPSEIIVGQIPEELFAIEDGMKFKLNLLSNKNSGYFPDMKNGRKFVRDNSKDKSVLNLFSYTCAFSIASVLGGATKVSNIDMNKSALSSGRINHHINNLDTRKVSFLPYNILKSFSRIKKKGPYDLIIIDPPTFQKGSFEATKDYRKLIMKLPQIASTECTLLACLNSPDLDECFIKDLITELAPSFKYSHRLENVNEFASEDESRSLKNLVFIRN